jgi:hypothetical protein
MRYNYILFFLFFFGVRLANIYLKKKLYDELVRRGFDPTKFVNELVSEKLADMNDKNGVY